MSKLITTEDGYEIRLGKKNPSCYPCENECPYMKQFINEDNDGNIETNHSDGRA